MLDTALYSPDISLVSPFFPCSRPNAVLFTSCIKMNEKREDCTVGKAREQRSINFLRGIPAEEALSRLIPMASEGYEKAIQRYGTELLQYGHINGFKPLRDLIGQSHHVDPQRVIAGNGGMEVISLFLKSLPRASTIIVEEVTYDRVLFDAEQYGHNLIGVELTSTGINLDQFKEVANKSSAAVFYGIPFHQNPTGINYSEENRQAVEQICREQSILCAWDICYEPLRYDGKQNTSITVSKWGPILMSSFTKTVSPGTKCGYIVLPKDYVLHMVKVLANTRINPNLPTQAFIADFIESGKYAEFLNYLCTLYRPKMDALNVSLNTHFPESSSVDISGGFFASISLQKITPEKEESFIKSALKAGVGIAAGWDAVAPNLREKRRKNGLFTRLTFPAYEPEEIRWGIAKLKELEEMSS
jgi:2-aminoadipate transaminase